MASSDVSHAPPTAVSCASNRVGGGGGGGGGGDEGSVARGRTALMESLNAKLGGASPQAKVVSMQPKNLGNLVLIDEKGAGQWAQCRAQFKQGWIHGQGQSLTGAQERNCAFSHFPNLITQDGRTDS